MLATIISLTSVTLVVLFWLIESNRRLSLKLDAVNQRIDGLYALVSAVDQRVAAVEQRLGVVEQRLGVVEQRLGVVEQRIGVVEQQVGSLAHDHLKMHEELQSLKSGLGFSN